MAEYGLILAGVAVVVFTALNALGGDLATLINNIASVIVKGAGALP